LKTININLIGELHKAPEYNKNVIQKDNLDTGTKIFVVVFLVGIFVVFILSFGTWLIANNLCGKHIPELTGLKAKHQALKDEETELSNYKKNLQKNLEIARFKLLAKEQVNNTFIPWSIVLKDLASKIPKNIVVLDIDKMNSGRQGNGSNELRISGIVPACTKSSRVGSMKIKPFTAVSFLILNINEDKNSFMGNAKIGRIEYKDEKDVYEFEIKTNVYTSKVKPKGGN